MDKLAVDACAKNLRATVFECAVQFTERFDFGRTDKRKILGPEKNDQPFSRVA